MNQDRIITRSPSNEAVDNHELHGSDHQAGFLRYKFNLGRRVNSTVTPAKIMFGGKFRSLIIMLVCLSLSNVCAQEPESATAVALKKRTATDFQIGAFSDATEVVLRSHDGVYGGTDDDLDLKLKPDGSVVITEHGYAVTSTKGRYKVKDDGTIVITPAAKSAWFPMPWSLEEGLLVIHPPDKEVLFEAARKIGIPETELTDTAYQESYGQFPLREIQRSMNGVTKR